MRIATFFNRKADTPAAQSAQPPESRLRTATGTGVQAKDTAGRVNPTLRRVRATTELPKFTQVLTAKGKRLQIAEADQKRIALLLLDSDRAVCVWTNRRLDEPSYRFVMNRARAEGMAIVEQFEADAQLLAVLHSSTPGGGDDAIGPEVVQTQGEVEKLLDRLTADAARVNASDIHIHYNPDGPTTIYFRMDGDLELEGQYPRSVGEALSRVAFVQTDDSSKMGRNTTEFDPRGFQGGALSRQVQVDGKRMNVSLRLSSRPVRGKAWDVILRVQIEGQGGAYWPLTRLGYDTPTVGAIERMLQKPRGMILLVGSTGSGKSRSLQSFLGTMHQAHGGRRSLVTIEDPPEYTIPGARAIPVLRGEGMGCGFAGALVEVMRQDPDIIMVGEIRDPETAKAAQQATQTGHHVFGTLHAASVHVALDRLVDLGVERSVLASPGFITGIIYQTLIIHVCTHCSVGFAEVRSHLPADFVARITTAAGNAISHVRFRGPGCEACKGKARAGRSVASQLLIPDMEYLALYGEGRSIDAQMYWRSQMAESHHQVHGRTELEHAIEKMRQGLMSPLDIEAQLGPLDGDTTPQQAEAWCRRRLNSTNAVPIRRVSGGDVA